MQNIKHFVISLLAVSALSACSKNKLTTFDNKPSVYFTASQFLWGRAFNEYDSVNINFGFTLPDVTDSLVSFGISVTGSPVDHDRTFKLAAATNSTAVAGTHYESFPGTFVMPAGQVRDTISVKFYRAEDLKTDTATLELELLPSDDFNTDLVTRESIDPTIDLHYIRLKLNTTDVLTAGINWSYGSLGKFSPKKLYIICDLTGCNPDMFSTNQTYNHNQAQAAYVLLPQYLTREKEEGRMVLYEDGTEMRTDDAQ